MLVLASNSPRRKELLTLGGWDFTVLAGEVDESVQPGEPPAAYVRRLAESKAHCALGLLPEAQRAGALLLAADTTVVDWPNGNGLGAEFQILGKPADVQEATAMLRSLRGRTHQVVSGLAVLRAADGWLHSEAVVTNVPMRLYSDTEIAAYVAGGDPMDKAGAYGIQHPSFRPVERLRGCYPNVMGLPVCRVARVLADLGLPPRADIFNECGPEGEAPCRVYRLATGAA